MNVDKVLLILIVASGTLLLPLFEPNVAIEISPKERIEIVINVRQPELYITVKGGSVNLNLSVIQGGGESPVYQNIEITKQVTLKGLEAGLYHMELSSEKFSKMVLDGRGMFQMNYGIFMVLAVAVLWRVARKY